MLDIHHNGGNRKLPVDRLIDVLAEHPLNSEFERYGGFWEIDPVSHYDGTPIYPDHPGTVMFSGNFLSISFAFQIATDEPELIERLQAAIEANTQSDAYLAQGTNRVCHIVPPDGEQPHTVKRFRVGNDVLSVEYYSWNVAIQHFINGERVTPKTFARKIAE